MSDERAFGAIRNALMESTCRCMIDEVQERWLGAFMLVVLGTACGAQAETSASVPAPAVVATTSIEADPTSLTSPSTTATTTATTTPSILVVATPTSVVPNTASLDSPIGRVSYVLPSQSWADPRDVGQLDDIAVGHAWWIVPDCCYLKLSLQDFAPPRPTEERVGQFESNGMSWDMYDIGPRDHSTLVASATVDGITISVSTQGRSGVSTDPSPSQIAESVARSVLVD